MEFIPKDLEKIILNYKYDLEKEEHKKNFQKTLDNIYNLKYNISIIVNNSSRYRTNIKLEYPIIIKYDTFKDIEKNLIKKINKEFNNNFSWKNIFIYKIKFNNFIIYDSSMNHKESINYNNYLVNKLNYPFF